MTKLQTVPNSSLQKALTNVLSPGMLTLNSLRYLDLCLTRHFLSTIESSKISKKTYENDQGGIYTELMPNLLHWSIKDNYN